jgi:rubredoxin
MGLIDAPPLQPVASTAPLGGRACPKCRARPTIQSAVKIRFGYEYQTLRCTSCGLVYDAQVQTDPLKSDDRGLIESELVPPKK